MVVNMLVNLKMDINMDMVYINGQMVVIIKDNGLIVN